MPARGMLIIINHDLYVMNIITYNYYVFNPFFCLLSIFYNFPLMHAKNADKQRIPMVRHHACMPQTSETKNTVTLAATATVINPFPFSASKIATTTPATAAMT